MGPRGVRDIAGPTLLGREFLSSADFMYLIIIAVILSIFLAKRLRILRSAALAVHPARTRP